MEKQFIKHLSMNELNIKGIFIKKRIEIIFILK